MIGLRRIVLGTEFGVSRTLVLAWSASPALFRTMGLDLTLTSGCFRAYLSVIVLSSSYDILGRQLYMLDRLAALFLDQALKDRSRCVRFG